MEKTWRVDSQFSSFCCSLREVVLDLELAKQIGVETFGAVTGTFAGLMIAVFPLEDRFSFRIGGIISHGFFRPYALTFDFTKMRLVLTKEPRT
jgi:hypothetical protein